MTNKPKMEAEETAALTALMDARRARVRLGRVEVREPTRPEPKRPEPRREPAAPSLSLWLTPSAASPNGAG
jgi:hypothetical protein